jgi:hypothetical protein
MPRLWSNAGFRELGSECAYLDVLPYSVLRMVPVYLKTKERGKRSQFVALFPLPPCCENRPAARLFSTFRDPCQWLVRCDCVNFKL